MVRNDRRNLMRIATAAVLAVLGLGVATADANRRASASHEARMLVKCQHQIADAGLELTSRLNAKMARCLLPLGDCSVGSAGRRDACDRAARACGNLPGEVASLKSRFASRVGNACGRLPVESLLDQLQFGEQMADCTVASGADFASCLGDNLHEAEAQSLVRMAPSACGYIEQFGLGDVFPPSMCLDGETCEQTPPPPPPTCEGEFYCGGPDAVACPDGMVCDRLDPMCGMPDVGGVCVPMPTECAPGSPVCGCDGQEYASDCERLMAGAVLAHEGACSASCFSNGDCAEGQFCDLPLGDCGESQMGTCKPMEDPSCNMCGEYLGAVCGCDLVTYASDCDRRAAGVSKFSGGACPFF